MGSDQTFDTLAAKPVTVPTQLVAPARISVGQTHLQLIKCASMKCRCSAAGKVKAMVLLQSLRISQRTFISACRTVCVTDH